MNQRVVIETFTATDPEGRRFTINHIVLRTFKEMAHGAIVAIDTKGRLATSDGQPINEEHGKLTLAADGRLLIRE